MYSYFTSLFAIALSVAAASAQNLGDIPQCAQTAALDSITSTGCGITDFQCICNSQSWLKSLLPDIEKQCSADDLSKTEEFASNLCAGQGVSLTFSATATAATAASATVNGTLVDQATSAVNQATSTSIVNVVTHTARPNSAATMVGLGEKGGMGKLMLSTLGVALGLMALR
ncbi:hypothetical protein MMC07_006280 [Pseudocyphellaria aurata]|nr:hypothetical protein [Pseudocyphellaria aurata]